MLRTRWRSLRDVARAHRRVVAGERAGRAEVAAGLRAPRGSPRPRACRSAWRSGRPSAAARSRSRPSRRRARRPAGRPSAGIDMKPPSGIVFAPHATRSPPSSMRRIERVRLELLQHVVRREPRVGVLEPDHEADAEVLGAHRVDERAADLAVLAAPRSGQPSVWMIRSSGSRDLPDLLDAERVGLRERASSSKWSSATPRRWPCVPSASTVACATISVGGAAPGGALPARSRPIGAVCTPRTAPSVDSSRSAVVSGSTNTPSSSACSPIQRVRRDSEKIQLPLLWNGGGVGSRWARRFAVRVDGLAGDRAVRGHLLERHVGKQLAQRRRVRRRAGEAHASRPLALLEHRDRHLAEPLQRRRVVREQLRQADRAGQAGRPAADDRDADVDALVGGPPGFLT